MARTGEQLRRRTREAMAAGSSPAARPNGRRTGPPRVGDRLRYAFDNSMAGGTRALIAWLSLVTVALIVVFALVVTLLGLAPDESDRGFFHELFVDLLHALDPGTIAGDEGSWRFLLTMLALTVAGLLIVSALIGVIATGIDAKLAELRRGRSLVLERDHTVILGWSDSIFTIVRELALANESRRRPVVVVLADRDKVAMEEDLRAKVPDLRGTRLVCRSGSPIDMDDLALASHQTARSVILLAPEDSEDPDAEVIKALLALTHSSTDGPRIVAEIRNPTNLEAAKLVGSGRTILLDIRETVAKLVVQTSRQSGAAAVYIELFDYSGAEIYFLADHGLVDATYADALLAFEEVAVIGLKDDAGTHLNPPLDAPVDGCALVVVAEDDSVLGTQMAAARVAPVVDQLGVADPQPELPRTALLIGWNERAPIVLRQLDHYAAPGSRLTVLTAFGNPIVPDLENLEVTVVRGSTTDRCTLESHVGPELDHVVVLCYSNDLEAQAADARTLVTLLHVRDILNASGAATTIVSEMLDDRNRVLAQVAHVDDIVVSGQIVSVLVTQLAEDPRREAVFRELLDSSGSEIYLKPAEWYVRPGEQVSFATIVEGAKRRGETALGYRTEALAQDMASGFGITVNPRKSDVFTVGPGDRVVVLADS